MWIMDIQNFRTAKALEVTYLKLKLICKLAGLKS